MPDMEAIADFSALAELPWSERIVQSVGDAKAFLDAVHDPALLFELALVREHGEVA